MSWRTIVVTTRAKLDFKMNYLEVRQGDSFKRILLSELSVLIIESTAVAITAYLMCELIKRKITVIFCDERHLPSGILQSLNGSLDSSSKIRKQILWDQQLKSDIWSLIISEKIKNQYSVLSKFGFDKESDLLMLYSDQVQSGDLSNREGFAAKVYFNCVLGKDLSRRDNAYINMSLNYGYAIILSYIAKEIVSNGCLTQIGIWHHGGNNNLNFACDLIEPFRPVVDDYVISSSFNDFGPEEKRTVKNILNLEFVFEEKKQYLSNIIALYVKSVIDCLNEGKIELKKTFLI